MTYEALFVSIGLDDHLLSDFLSEEIVEHPSGIFLDQRRNRGCFATDLRVAKFGGFLQPR